MGFIEKIKLACKTIERRVTVKRLCLIEKVTFLHTTQYTVCVVKRKVYTNCVQMKIICTCTMYIVHSNKWIRRIVNYLYDFNFIITINYTTINLQKFKI